MTQTASDAQTVAKDGRDKMADLQAELDSARAKRTAKPDGKAAVFARVAIPDFLLCLAVSWGLASTVLYAFTVDSTFAADTAVALAAMMPPLAVLFVAGWSRRLIPFSVVGCVVLLAVYLGIGVTMTPGDSAFGESEGNRLIPMIVWFTVPVLVHLLSRRVWGLAGLLLLSLIACGTVEYLYEGGLFVQFFFVAAGLLAMFVYQTYRQSIMGAKRARVSGFLPAFGGALAMAAVSVGVAAAVFYGIIAPLNPPAAELKLFQEEYALETIEFTGMYQDTNDEDPDNKTDQTNEEQDDTNESDSKDVNAGTAAPSPLENLGNTLSNVVSAFGMEEEPEDYQGISYQILRVTSLAFLAVIVVAIVAAVLLKRHGRKRRLDKLAGKTNAEKVMALFGFLESRLARMGFKRPENLTAGEYAVASYRGMKAFSRDTDDVSFLNVTDLFYRARYGGLDVDDAEYAKVESFYRAFFKNARRYVGWPKWIAWKFWRI